MLLFCYLIEKKDGNTIPSFRGWKEKEYEISYLTRIDKRDYLYMIWWKINVIQNGRRRTSCCHYFENESKNEINPTILICFNQ